MWKENDPLEFGKGLSLKLFFTSIFLTCVAYGVYVELKMAFVGTLCLGLREADALRCSLELLEKLRAGWSLKALQSFCCLLVVMGEIPFDTHSLTPPDFSRGRISPLLLTLQKGQS